MAYRLWVRSLGLDRLLVQNVLSWLCPIELLLTVSLMRGLSSTDLCLHVSSANEGV